MAVLLPQRERRALDDIDLQPPGIKFQHRGLADPRIGLELVANRIGIQKQQRRAAIDPADREHLVLAQLLAAVDADGGDTKSGGIGQRVAGIAQRLGQFLDMTAFDDAETCAAEQDQHGGGDAGAVRQIALDQRDQPVRIGLALGTQFGRLALGGGGFGLRQTLLQPLAQQHVRANGGGFQISLGPQRSHRSSEASCTIHCTSSSNVVPAKALRVPAQMTSW